MKNRLFPSESPSYIAPCHRFMYGIIQCSRPVLRIEKIIADIMIRLSWRVVDLFHGTLSSGISGVVSVENGRNKHIALGENENLHPNVCCQSFVHKASMIVSTTRIAAQPW